MRSVILSLALVVGVVGVTSAQEPAPWLAVQSCLVKPGEGPALRAALREFIDYVVASDADLPPANVYGGFFQRVNGPRTRSLVVEVESIAAWDAWDTAGREARRNDPRRQELYRAYRSHYVPQSCEWSFHQRFP